MKHFAAMKKSLLPALQLFLGGCVGACCVLLLAANVPQVFQLPMGWYLAALGGCMLWLAAALWLHTLLHEAGHLLGGLAGGYRFVSFRVGSFIWMRRGGKIERGRFSIAGTGGQCLMAPPAAPDGMPPAPYPWLLYNLSGALANWAAGALLALSYVLAPPGLARLALALAALAGAAAGAANLLPIPGSDGGNLRTLRHSPDARRAMWVLLSANARLTEGQSAAQLPPAWFDLPAPGAQADPLTAAVHLQRGDVLTAQGRLAEAEALYRALPGQCPRMLPLHRCEARCNAQLLALLQGRTDPEPLGPETERYLRASAAYPSHACLLYARAVLQARDKAAAQKQRAVLERAGRAYPYPAEAALYQSFARRADALAAQRDGAPAPAAH